MNSIYQGEYFQNTGDDIKKSEYDLSVVENLGQLYDMGQGIRNLELVHGLDKTVTDLSKVMIPCSKEEIGRLAFDNGANFSLKSYYTQLGYEKVMLGDWNKPTDNDRDRKISYQANFKRELGGLANHVKICQSYSNDQTQMTIENNMKLGNLVVEG